MASPLERYKKLKLEETLSKICRYPLACRELSSILKLGYDRFPKNVQALIFQDTLTAFRLLPDMHTSAAVSAAHLLLKSAEAVLPKQKRNFAAAELKHAKVALKRRCKTRVEATGSPQLPQDLLLHIFSFLDVASLVSAGQVCRSWNLAVHDNNLWRLQYYCLFGDSNDSIHQTNTDWRQAFKKAYIDSSSKALRSPWGYCYYCSIIVWHNNLQCPNEQCRSNQGNGLLDPISSLKVVDYVLNDFFIETCSSDSGSDDEYVFRLWAFPRLTL